LQLKLREFLDSRLALKKNAKGSFSSLRENNGNSEPQARLQIMGDSE
jgi:hypothetical protein